MSWVPDFVFVFITNCNFHISNDFFRVLITLRILLFNFWNLELLLWGCPYKVFWCEDVLFVSFVAAAVQNRKIHMKVPWRRTLVLLRTERKTKLCSRIKVKSKLRSCKVSHENAVKQVRNYRYWPLWPSTFHPNPTNIQPYTSLSK